MACCVPCRLHCADGMLRAEKEDGKGTREGGDAYRWQLRQRRDQRLCGHH